MSDVHLKIPCNYSEMTADQVRYVIALKLAGTEEKNIWRKCFIKYTGIRPIVSYSDQYFFVKKNITGFFSLKLDEFNYFAKQLSFLTTSYVGMVPWAIKKLSPCDEELRDTNFIQYLDAETEYEHYIFSKDIYHLDQLIATLYQPGEKYNNNRTEKIARSLHRVSESDKMMVFMWFMGVKQLFAQKWPELFPKPKNSDDDIETDPVVPDMEKIIRSRIRLLTQGDITKERDILKAQTWSALDELNEKIREAEELKQKLESKTK